LVYAAIVIWNIITSVPTARLIGGTDYKTW
jgi:hypothetical protein